MDRPRQHDHSAGYAHIPTGVSPAHQLVCPQAVHSTSAHPLRHPRGERGEIHRRSALVRRRGEGQSTHLSTAKHMHSLGTRLWTRPCGVHRLWGTLEALFRPAPTAPWISGGYPVGERPRSVHDHRCAVDITGTNWGRLGTVHSSYPVRPPIPHRRLHPHLWDTLRRQGLSTRSTGVMTTTFWFHLSIDAQPASR